MKHMNICVYFVFFDLDRLQQDIVDYKNERKKMVQMKSDTNEELFPYIQVGQKPLFFEFS